MNYIRFPGFRTLRKLLLQLYVPTHRSTPPPHTSPMVVCVQPEGHTRVVGVLAEQFEPAGGRRVPHANVTERPDSTGGNALDLRYRDVLELRSLLGAICNELARTEGGGYRFPRFRLLQWLMEVDLPSAPPEDRIVELQKRLQDRSLGRIAHRKDPVSDLPWRLRLLGWVLTPAYFWVRQSGVVPGFGRQYRWFLRRQPNLAPRPHRTFFSLAERLAPPEWKREDPEQVRRLLVNAFLADLRREHRRIGWFRRYRTTVPIVLLDRDAVPGADTLIRTIGAVRNETGIDDPLLLVTSGSALPAFVAHPDGGDVSALPQPTACGEDATEVLERWRAQLPHERRRRNEAAWVVVCDLTNDRDLRQLPPREPAKRGRQSFEPGHPPLWRRRWVAAVLAGVVVAVPTAVGVFDDWRTCGTGLTWLLEERLPSELERIDDVCIGVLDPGDPRLPYPEVLGGVGATIHEFNRRADELHREQPDRPLVTLVLLAGIDPVAGGGDAPLTAVREQMVGMAVLQEVQLEKAAQPFEPLVRVLIANAGPTLAHGRTAAEKVGRMAAADPSVVAVVGPNQSRVTTEQALESLGAAGLPTVAAVLTADALFEASRLYFSVAPQNSRQAAVTAAYVDHLIATGEQPTGRPLARRARIYVADDPGDIFSRGFADELATRFGERGFAVEQVAFTPAGFPPGDPGNAGHVTDAAEAGREACDADGVVLYAGRGNPDFRTFIDGVAYRCKNRPPYIIASSDVTTYVADRDVSGANRSVPFEYLSHALAPELGGPVPVEVRDFYARLYELFPWEQTNLGRSLDGYAALTYDAGFTVVAAAGHLGQENIAISGAAVWPALMAITDAGDETGRYQGVSGVIDFGGTIERRVPVDKPVAIVRFADGAPSAERNIVCAGRDDPATPAWCPADR